MSSLADRFRDIVDGYYSDSHDFKFLTTILQEVDFLHSRGILAERGLGRFVDILNEEIEFVVPNE